MAFQSSSAPEDCCPVLNAFLSSQGLSKHLEKLAENEVDFETLLIFEESDLKELGIAKGPRVKMLRTMLAWQESMKV